MSFLPKILDDFVINKHIANTMKKYTSNDIPNIIFYGVNNAGKKTLSDCLLNSIFNDDVKNKKVISQSEIRIGNNKVEIDYLSTKYHIEINLYEYGLYDKDILTDFVFELICNKSISIHPYKILIINHADKTSINSQLILRRIIDKCNKTARFILICENLANIDTSLRSRFNIVRVPKPSHNDIKEYLMHVSKRHHKLTVPQQNRILSTCNNDLYLLNQIIMATIENPKFNFNKLEDVNRDVNKIFKLIELPNIKSILEIRSICYNLLLLNFSMKDLFIKISNHFIEKIKQESKPLFAEYVAEVNHNMGNIEHDIICIEYLVLKVKKELLLNK